MRHSDIFDQFVKIAEEKGLISKSSEEEHTEQNTKNPRWDSYSIKDIEKLYNNKLDAPKDMQYKHNIMEIAHPDRLVISPAADKMNGLFENEIDGQNIRLNIITKPNNGQLIQDKLAKKNLLLSLVRIANDLDNKQSNLTSLADTCLQQASGFKKTAFPFVVATIATLFGVFYAQQHLSRSSGIIGDAEKLKSDINDFYTSNSNWGVGQDYSQVFLTMLKKFQTVVESFDKVVKETLPVIQGYQLPKTGKELIEQAHSADGQKAAEALNKLNTAYQEAEPFFKQVVSNFSNEAYKLQQIAHKGFLTDVIDQTKVLHGGWGLVKDDFDDITQDLKQYMEDTNQLFEALKRAQSIKEEVAQKISENTQEFNKREKPVVFDKQENKPEDLPDIENILSLK